MCKRNDDRLAHQFAHQSFCVNATHTRLQTGLQTGLHTDRYV